MEENMSNVSIAIPDDVMQRLEGQWPDVSRHVLEAVAIEAYRMGVLTSAEIQRMLQLQSRWDVEALLKRAQAYIDYTEADLEQDLQTLDRVVITRNGKPVALIVSVEGLDEEQLELGSSDTFWKLMTERRAQKTMSRSQLEQAIDKEP